jgi:hypothetical protein
MCREAAVFLAFLASFGVMLLAPQFLLSQPHLPALLFQTTLGVVLIFFPILMLDLRERNDCYLMGRKLQKVAFEGVVLFSLMGVVELFVPNPHPLPLVIALFVSLITYAFGKWLEAEYGKREKRNG